MAVCGGDSRPPNVAPGLAGWRTQVGVCPTWIETFLPMRGMIETSDLDRILRKPMPRHCIGLLPIASKYTQRLGKFGQLVEWLTKSLAFSSQFA